MSPRTANIDFDTAVHPALANENLPVAVLKYIARIEELVNCPVVIFGTGQSRAETFGHVSWT